MSRKSKAAEFVAEEYSLSVVGRNVQVTDAMKDYAIEKLAKLEKYGTRIIDVAMVMEVQRFEHIVDVVVKLNQIKIKASATSEDMYASIDKAIDKIQVQLRKYKQKIQDHHARPLEEIDMVVNFIKPTELDEINEDIDEETYQRLNKEYRPHEILSRKTVPLKFLSLDEAIMKMELSKDPFLVFMDEKKRNINVIFRRKDGHFGLMDLHQGKA